jgi:NAD(P) transhydrogenase subunit beta
MPVVISLLNAFSGLAAAAAGFVLDNHVLIVSGSLVGSSGIILTRIMCWAMNRSLSNVLFSAFGSVVAAPGTAAGAAGRAAKAVTADEVATLLGYANSVIVAPGYGLAVSRAQNEVRDMARMLEARGVEVKYAIHPVAGRMPGHMNVLLAEADIPYDKLLDMDQINPEFPNTDVAVVLGANDVVNPAARYDTSSPLYGMPILDVDRAKHVIVIKRSLNPGFAGVDNELFYLDNTRMFFADGRKALVSIMEELKNL